MRCNVTLLYIRLVDLKIFFLVKVLVLATTIYTHNSMSELFGLPEVSNLCSSTLNPMNETKLIVKEKSEPCSSALKPTKSNNDPTEVKSHETTWIELGAIGFNFTLF